MQNAIGSQDADFFINIGWKRTYVVTARVAHARQANVYPSDFGRQDRVTSSGFRNSGRAISGRSVSRPALRGHRCAHVGQVEDDFEKGEVDAATASLAIVMRTAKMLGS